MKHLLRTSVFFLSIFSICLFANGQACTPNNDTVSGITPDTLAVAYLNIPYEEIIYFRLPPDTNVAFIIGQDTVLVHVCIDSLTIDSVQGLPEGFSYACNMPWCSVHGGGNGCASISGTTQSPGIYPLNVFVTIYTNDCYGFALPPTVDTVTIYYIDVQEPSGMTDFAPENVFSLGKIFPNPVRSEVSVPYYLPVSGEALIFISNLEGITCFQKSFLAKHGYNIGEVDISMFPEGFYLVRVEYKGSSLFSKMQVIKKK